MIKIAICEDQLEDLNFLQEHLHQLLTEKEISYNITCFTSGKDMLKCLEKQLFSIYFIDIYLDEVSGILLAQTIREKNREAPLVFTTRSQDHYVDGFELGVLHYLTKPFTYEQVKEALERSLKVASYNEQFLEVVVNRERMYLLYREIVFIESQNRYCRIVTTSGDFMVYTRLDDLEEQLVDARFLRCHRSFIVNMDKIAWVEKRDFILINSQRIPMTRDAVKRHKAAFADYRIKKVREEE